MNALPSEPKPTKDNNNKLRNHMTLMIDKNGLLLSQDVMQNKFPEYYNEECSVYNIYHSRCKSAVKW